jgi:hypothetical protein
MRLVITGTDVSFPPPLPTSNTIYRCNYQGSHCDGCLLPGCPVSCLPCLRRTWTCSLPSNYRSSTCSVVFASSHILCTQTHTHTPTQHTRSRILSVSSHDVDMLSIFRKKKRIWFSMMASLISSCKTWEKWEKRPADDQVFSPASCTA